MYISHLQTLHMSLVRGPDVPWVFWSLKSREQGFRISEIQSLKFKQLQQGQAQGSKSLAKAPVRSRVHKLATALQPACITSGGPKAPPVTCPESSQVLASPASISLSWVVAVPVQYNQPFHNVPNTYTHLNLKSRQGARPPWLWGFILVNPLVNPQFQLNADAWWLMPQLDPNFPKEGLSCCLCTVLIQSICWSHITGVWNWWNSEGSQVTGPTDETTRSEQNWD